MDREKMAAEFHLALFRQNWIVQFYESPQRRYLCLYELLWEQHYERHCIVLFVKSVDESIWHT